MFEEATDQCEARGLAKMIRHTVILKREARREIKRMDKRLAESLQKPDGARYKNWHSMLTLSDQQRAVKRFLGVTKGEK